VVGFSLALRALHNTRLWGDSQSRRRQPVLSKQGFGTALSGPEQFAAGLFNRLPGLTRASATWRPVLLARWGPSFLSGGSPSCLSIGPETAMEGCSTIPAGGLVTLARVQEDCHGGERLRSDPVGSLRCCRLHACNGAEQWPGPNGSQPLSIGRGAAERHPNRSSITHRWCTRHPGDRLDRWAGWSGPLPVRQGIAAARQEGPSDQSTTLWMTRNMG